MKRAIPILVSFTHVVFAHELPPFEIIYHGSPLQFESVEPRSPVESKSNNFAIFGAFDKRIALFYTHTRRDDIKADINLQKQVKSNDPLIFKISGGQSLEEAIEKLWGPIDESPESTGYLYLLDGRHFIQEPGLGAMERICPHSNCNIGKVPIHRRREIEYYREMNLIQFDWSQEAR